MRGFINERPVWFAIAIHVFILVLGLLIFTLGNAISLPGMPLRVVAILIFTALPLFLIWWMGWWQDAGFVTTTKNVPALAAPLIIALLPVAWFGTVSLERGLVILLLVFAFLTGLSEEALSRGLLMRAILPKGKWQSVLITSMLFGIAHISQYLFLGMPLNDNLIVIADSVFKGFLYGGVRLRVNNLWPLIIIHMLNDTFYPYATLGRIDTSDIPVAFWAVTWLIMLISGFYLVRRPVTATIDGQAVG